MSESLEPLAGKPHLLKSNVICNVFFRDEIEEKHLMLKMKIVLRVSWRHD